MIEAKTLTPKGEPMATRRQEQTPAEPAKKRTRRPKKVVEAEDLLSGMRETIEKEVTDPEKKKELNELVDDLKDHAQSALDEYRSWAKGVINMFQQGSLERLTTAVMLLEMSACIVDGPLQDVFRRLSTAAVTAASTKTNPFEAKKIMSRARMIGTVAAGQFVPMFNSLLDRMVVLSTNNETVAKALVSFAEAVGKSHQNGGVLTENDLAELKALPGDSWKEMVDLMRERAECAGCGKAHCALHPKYVSNLQ
jgi:hypothetical protein